MRGRICSSQLCLSQLSAGLAVASMTTTHRERAQVRARACVCVSILKDIYRINRTLMICVSVLYEF